MANHFAQLADPEPLECVRLLAAAVWCLLSMGDRAQGKEELSSAAQFVEFKNGYHSYEEFTQMDFSGAAL